MITKEKFHEIEYETEAKYGFGCGYWNVCDDHACACALTSKGFSEEVYASMERQQREDRENLEHEFEEVDYLDEFDNDLEEDEDSICSGCDASCETCENCQ